MNKDYLDSLSPKSLLNLQKLDFRSKEAKQLKKKLGNISSQTIKKKIQQILRSKNESGIQRHSHLNPESVQQLIKTQSVVRRYIILSRLDNFGPYYFNSNLSNNSFDFFSYQDIKLIPLLYLISFKDRDNFVYTFDIRSLDKLFKSDYNVNPFNRQPFPEKVIRLVSKRISNLVVCDSEPQIEEKKKRKIRISDDNSNIKTRAVDLFQKMDKLDQYTNVNWFCDLNLKQLKNFYRFLEDIWNYRTQISLEQKKKISKNGDVCSIPIPYILKIKKLSDLQEIILDQIELLVTGGETKDEQILGCLYVLTAFAETSSKIAECLPWLMNS